MKRNKKSQPTVAAVMLAKKVTRVTYYIHNITRNKKKSNGLSA